MSKIEEMIKNGNLELEDVDRVNLGEYIDIYTGVQLNKAEMQDKGFYPVINGGIQPSGYVEKYNEPTDTITISQGGASAGYVNFLKTPFWAGAHCFVIRSKCKSLNNKYLYYFIKEKESYLQKSQHGAGIPSINRDKIKDLLIPLPPLSIQREIVSVLDSFTTLIDKMKHEVELRKKQMEYYCDKLYGGDFEGMMGLANTPGNSVVQFSDLGSITRGKRFVRDDVRESGQPCIHYGDMYTYYGTKCDKTKTYIDKDFPKKMSYAQKGDIVIVGAGENDYDIGVGLVWMGDEPVAVHDACYILKHKQNPMYISYYLRSNIYHQQLKSYVSSGKICSFSKEGLGKIYIPIQSEEKQRSIVSTLDTFEQYVSKLERLISLREKQYAYYREKLLTFE